MRFAALLVPALLFSTVNVATPPEAEEARFGRLTADQRELAELKGARTDIALDVTLDQPTATYRIGDTPRTHRYRER